VNETARTILLAQSIEPAIELSARTRDCLCRANITTFGQLLKKTPSQLREIKGFGKKSLDELRTKLKQLDLSLNEEH
jgi:DNA-directed RNA polymerase subunit alpha